MQNTRAVQQVEFEGAGVSGAALDALLHETAPFRHLCRVGKAKKAAEDFVLQAIGLDRDEIGAETLACQAASVCWCDCAGIGGRDGCEGASTLRHPAFRRCGKGRKQATDGSAWTAAILQAAYELCPGFRFKVNELGYLCAESSGCPIGHVPVGGPLPFDCQSALDDASLTGGWAYTIAREGLRRAAGVGSWNATLPIVAPSESVGLWAGVVNGELGLSAAVE